jgi:hypothetical protein
MGWAVTGRGVDVGVDFEEETVEEEIVIALPEEGGMRGLGAGVVAVEVEGGALERGSGGAVGAWGVVVVVLAEVEAEDGRGSGTRRGGGAGCCSWIVEATRLSCAGGAR